MALRTLLQIVASRDPDPDMPGRFAGECRLEINRDWAGVPLQLDGSGTVAVAEADLWNVPILAELGRLLDVPLLARLTGGRISGLGRISELRADLDFRGTQVRVPHVSTNGTIISLRGQGEYSWQTRGLDFHIEGVPLKQVSVLRWFLRPLSMVFGADLGGTLDRYRWQLSTPLTGAMGTAAGR
jgi:hypothetical protein